MLRRRQRLGDEPGGEPNAGGASQIGPPIRPQASIGLQRRWAELRRCVAALRCLIGTEAPEAVSHHGLKPVLFLFRQEG
jgi:hypothetical protein